MESSSTSRRRAGSAPPVSATSSRADSTPYEPTSDADGTRKRLDYLAEADLDLAIFQQIPLYVRSRVLKEGKVLFVRDEDRLSIACTWTPSRVVDRERILARLDDLDGFLRELRSIAPKSLDEYLKTEKRRACERLLPVSLEALIYLYVLVLPGLRLGIPGEEGDLFVASPTRSFSRQSATASG